MTAAYDDWAAFYDVTDADRAPFFAFYTSLVRPTDTSVLELGCGTGTVTAAVADALGECRRLAGVDESEGMLRVARDRRPDGEWIRGDMRQPPVEGLFDLVLCCFNTLQLLHDEADLRQALAAARRLLAPGGRVAFDLYQPNPDYLRVPAVDRSARVSHDPQGRRLEIREDATYDEATRLLSLDWRLVDADGEQLASTSYALRQWLPSDIERAVAESGLGIEARYGDFDRSAFTSASKKQIYVLRAAGT